MMSKFYYVYKYDEFNKALIQLFLDKGPLFSSEISKYIIISKKINEKALWGSLYSSGIFSKNDKTKKWNIDERLLKKYINENMLLPVTKYGVNWRLINI